MGVTVDCHRPIVPSAITKTASYVVPFVEPFFAIGIAVFAGQVGTGGYKLCDPGAALANVIADVSVINSTTSEFTSRANVQASAILACASWNATIHSCEHCARCGQIPRGRRRIVAQ